MRQLLVLLMVFVLTPAVWGQCVKCPKCGKFHCQPTASAPAGDSLAEVVRLVNNERGKRGISLLSYSPDMGAQQHSRNQQARRSMHHARSGYSENMAAGQRSPSSVMRSWMNSSGHRNNILNRRWTRIDVGRSGNYWTQRFR